MQIPITYISFPEIKLHPHYGHKLRGYFGNLFQEKSPLLHNHYDDGKLRYKYPLVQYKVINGTPMLVGIGEGGDLLSELFLEIKFLDLDDLKINIYSKNIKRTIYEPQIFTSDYYYRYTFKSLWMALNQKNYRKYLELTRKADGPGIMQMLTKILIGNVLSFYKGIGYTANYKITVLPLVEPRDTQFKNKKMTGFTGDFYSNALLPDFVGIGKSVSRGFGTILNSNK